MFIFFVMVFLGVVLPAQTTFAHDAAIIVPTRLDFDASQAPKNCNDDVTFRNLLAIWVDLRMLSLDAARRLIVRIRRSPAGGKLAELTLLDTSGSTLAEKQRTFASKTECHKVLYDTAYDAATLLGAFEKPPVPEPATCPAIPACSACPAPTRCPLPPSLPTSQHAPSLRARASYSSRRAFIGAGVFFGTGITSDVSIGPHVSLGFVPSRHLPRIQIEIDGAWTSQTLRQSNAPEPLRVQAVPLLGSLCYSRYIFRICSGMTTTFFQAERTDLAPGNDSIRMRLAGHLRIGTEFAIAGPFSLRFDAYAQLRFGERTFGRELATLDKLSPFGAGAVAMGVWSFE